jgi:hypothetical protein
MWGMPDGALTNNMLVYKMWARILKQ